MTAVWALDWRRPMSRKVCTWLLLMVLLGTLSAIAAMPRDEPELKTQEGRTAFAERVVARLRSTPVVVVSLDIKSKYPRARVLAQMDKVRIRRFVWVGEEERPDYAQFKDGAIIQEYASHVEFKNGTSASNVLIEYPEDLSGWSKTIQQDVACNLGSTSQ